MSPEILKKSRHATIFLLMAVILATFLGRALLSAYFTVPHTLHLFDTLTIAGSLFILSKNHSSLRQGDGRFPRAPMEPATLAHRRGLEFRRFAE